MMTFWTVWILVSLGSFGWNDCTQVGSVVINGEDVATYTCVVPDPYAEEEAEAAYEAEQEAAAPTTNSTPSASIGSRTGRRQIQRFGGTR